MKFIENKQQFFQVMGTVYWSATAQEAGTIWPHMHRIPSACAVDNLGAKSAEVFIVDSAKALAIMAKMHPKEFEFLAQCTLEYSEGLFRSMHKVIHVSNGRILPVGFC